MEFSRQEYQSGLPFPSPGDLSDSGIKPGSSALQADSSSEPTEPSLIPFNNSPPSNKSKFMKTEILLSLHIAVSPMPRGGRWSRNICEMKGRSLRGIRDFFLSPSHERMPLPRVEGVGGGPPPRAGASPGQREKSQFYFPERIGGDGATGPSALPTPYPSLFPASLSLPRLSPAVPSSASS